MYAAVIYTERGMSIARTFEVEETRMKCTYRVYHINPDGSRGEQVATHPYVIEDAHIFDTKKEADDFIWSQKDSLPVEEFIEDEIDLLEITDIFKFIKWRGAAKTKSPMILEESEEALEEKKKQWMDIFCSEPEFVCAIIDAVKNKKVVNISEPYDYTGATEKTFEL